MEKKNNSFGVLFYLKKYKQQGGRSPVYARITVNGKRADISVKQLIEEKSWNSSKGMAKGSRTEIAKLNNYLEQFRSKIVEIYQEMLLAKKLITPEAIKNNFLSIGQQHYTLSALMEYHNEVQQPVLAWGTMKNYHTTQKYIRGFLKETMHTPDIYLSELNYKFITDFEHYLRRHMPKDHQKRLQNNGVMKHLERLQKMVRLSVKLGWLDRDPFQQYQLKFQKVDRGYLTDKELAALENKRFAIARMEWVKDLFVFSCYTGLSYTDVMKLTPGSVVAANNNVKWIETKREKTSVPVKIPLLAPASEIIKKYSNDPRAVSKGTLFPVISNQKLNSYLKEIADLCGITKNLTFHLARHTFATTVTLTNGVPIETVSKMLGHTKLSTTQIYARVIQQKVTDDMQVLQDKLNDKKGKPYLQAI